MPRSYGVDLMSAEIVKAKINLRRSMLALLKIPRKVECRICKNKFKNPLLEGSSIVIKTCPECRDSMKRKKTRRNRK